jgi:hypothetical protein
MRNAIALLLLLTFSFSLSAQERVYNSSGKTNGYKQKKKKGGYDPAKLVLGGGVNFAYSNVFANFGLSPRIGYKVTDFLAVGTGIGYQWVRWPYPYYVNNEVVFQQSHTIYPSLWTKCMIFDPFFIAADFEMNFMQLRSWQSYLDIPTNTVYYKPWRGFVTVPAALVGAGIKQSLGGRVSGTVELMYDVIQDENSPYFKQLVYRAAIFVGL